MSEQDTIQLLRECDAGIKMGVASIDEVVEYVKNQDFKQKLLSYRTEHEKLKDEIQVLLEKHHDSGKEPTAMAKGMSWLKTNMKLAMDTSDQTIADLMTDGCNMGVKSVYRYLNQYATANEKAKEQSRKLANLEEKMCTEFRQFL
ncbi:MAG TPA: hypothetical protein H9667_10715 [Firmicutes bacterium]|nr:hypothetical protein [Bacillales bacterium]HJA41958.1 hypothetical protein [Bacillota bacterium]